MAQNNNASEDQIVDWIVGLIEAEELTSHIQGAEDIDTLVSTFAQEDMIPAFGIDHLSRRASARAAQIVLKSLWGLQVVSKNLSISLTKGETLRPDILCFSPETQSFVIFEVKRDKLTERQAVTELAGYEQELRNTLPFLGDFDINFVIVSTEWDTLLDHAIANFNTWSSKYCLALHVSAESETFSMKFKLPEAWHLRGAVGLPDDALQTIDVYFEQLESDGQEDLDDNEVVMPPTLITATNALARAGDRLGSHGFVVLWRDHSNYYSKGQWAWTLCGVDPISMYKWCCLHGIKIRTSDLSKFLDGYSEESTLQVPSAVYRAAKETFPILRNRYKPSFEAPYSWSSKLNLIRERSNPFYFEFWGTLGDYARDFVSQAVVRERYMPFIEQIELDWTVPEVALPLLSNITSENPFPDGLVRCSSAFNCGVTLGLYGLLATNLQGNETASTRLKSLVRWSFLEALRMAVEMAEIYKTVGEVTDPPPALSNSEELRASSINELSIWVMDHLIGKKHPIHQMCFRIGHIGAVYFSDWLDQNERQGCLEQIGNKLAQDIRELLTAIIHSANTFDQSLGTFKRLSNFLNMIGIKDIDPMNFDSEIEQLSDILLLETFKDAKCLPFDEVVPAVFHTVEPLPVLAIDWTGLKKSIREIYDSGCTHPAVIVSQNGTFGVGKLEGYMQIMSPLMDPEKEVFFLDSKSYMASAIRLTWEDLQEKFKNHHV